MTEKIFLKAFWESSNSALVFLSQDWDSESLRMPLELEPDRIQFSLERAGLFDVARLSGYFVHGDSIRFVVDPASHPSLEPDEDIYVAGLFNNWQEAIGKEEFRLVPWEMSGNPVRVVDVPLSILGDNFSSCFRFVTADHRWISVPEFAPNLVPNRYQGSDFSLNLRQTGRHVFRLRTEREMSLSSLVNVRWTEGSTVESIAISNAEFYLTLQSDLPMGVTTVSDGLTFRLFAPRANRVTLALFKQVKAAEVEYHELKPNRDGSWERTLPFHYDRWFYYYYVDGINRDGSTYFDYTFPIVDPYAKAMASSKGPGIVINPATLKPLQDGFHPPHWHDLVISEVHMRDLMAKSKYGLSKTERTQFSGMARWLREPGNYLKKLGVNALEFLPLHEFEYESKDEYHWGYMPVNYFSPASCNERFPKSGAQIEGMQEMVRACHEAGFAFILDVVYNHTGSPNALYAIDKHYYFEVDSKFNLTNWSGVGNDLRARSPMAKKLIIDSLTWYMTHYGVDGFRFDLAELIGRDVLHEIEKALKKVNPAVILIAEPWSFRGHIAEKLKVTGYTSWNDRFRDFFVEYLSGKGTHEQCRYFVQGSPGNLTRFPAQTVNYSESHDDHCWLDMITENPYWDGAHPTLNDIRRTHLMFALLFISQGIPMIAGGQDFLRSKRGVRNTYQRGDLNALDYDRLITFSSSHDYVRSWISFRLSEAGRGIRLQEHPEEGYFEFFKAVEGSSATAFLINARGRHGSPRLFFAINPTQQTCNFDFSGVPLLSKSRQIADHFRFNPKGLDSALLRPADVTLQLPPLSCGLWLVDS
jgi:pullulanase